MNESYYQLIDLSSGNVVGEYEDKAEALADLRRAVENHGVDRLCDFSLMELSDAEQTLVAMRDDLLRLAFPGHLEMAQDRRTA